jgi:hypothetical protein
MLEHDREHARQLLALLAELAIDAPSSLPGFARE